MYWGPEALFTTTCQSYERCSPMVTDQLALHWSNSVSMAKLQILQYAILRLFYFVNWHYRRMFIWKLAWWTTLLSYDWNCWLTRPFETNQAAANSTRLKFLFDNLQSHARWLTRESYKYHLKVLNSFVKLFTTAQPCLYSHTLISLSNPYFYNLYTSSTCLTHLWFNSFGVFSVWSFDTCSL